MNTYTAADLQEASQPIASLISKSEKALQKLTPGTWQYTMLRDNLKALYCVSVLMSGDTREVNDFTQAELHEALRVITSMIHRTENVKTTFVSGTSQYALQQNRLKALRIAALLITETSGC